MYVNSLCGHQYVVHQVNFDIIGRTQGLITANKSSRLNIDVWTRLIYTGPYCANPMLLEYLIPYYAPKWVTMDLHVLVRLSLSAGTALILNTRCQCLDTAIYTCTVSMLSLGIHPALSFFTIIYLRDSPLVCNL